MKAQDYRYFYQQRYLTAELLSKHVYAIEEDDKNQFIKEIGKYLYEFRIEDRYSSWNVLKTHHEIHKFLNIRHNPYTYFKLPYNLKKINDHEQFQDKSFEIAAMPDAYRYPIPNYVIKFFQIYNTNIEKITSFIMQKKTRGLTWIKKLSNWCCGVEWSDRQIIITREGVLQMTEDGSVTDFLKFDLYFRFQSGMEATRHEFGVALSSAQRKIVLKARNIKQFLIFLFYLSKGMQNFKQRMNYLGSCKRNQQNTIDYYIDAKQYYQEVAHSIQKAQNDVMICGWWVSPELYLIRPLDKKTSLYWRLDNLLKRKAQAGVKIYIVVFFAPPIIPNDSDYTKRILQNLHPNIHVQRHPSQIIPILWSHHQKVVIIDQKVALMGGLDLCYGRYDSHQHPININSKEMYPGIDYNNVRIKDFLTVSNFQQDLQDRNLPRMPWHDIAYKVTGKIVSDVANHFVQYWNFTILEKTIAPIVGKSQTKTRNHIESRQNLDPSKMQTKAVFNIVGSILQMVTDKQKKEFELFLDSKSKMEQMINPLRSEWSKKKLELNNGPGQNCLLLRVETLGLLKEDEKIKKERDSDMKDELQLLRSASEWSIGLEEGVTERSIQNAYLSVIKNSQRFIYIQNQFFISATGEKDSYVQNQIANALYQRIKTAIENNEKFRVVVFMPLLPGMEGQLSQKCPLSLKLTMYWQFNTISQGKSSLISRIAELTPHPEDYIQFYSLRNHGILENKPVTQLIYIHSKLMIVDDHIVICGSANINDRSQQGNRDSQLATIFTNGQKTNANMDGRKFEVNRKAHSLRVRLFMEHFDMTQRQAEDPLSQKTINLTREIAKRNTEFYRQIFGCCPDNIVKKLTDVKAFQKQFSEQMVQLYKKKINQIRGHAVEFPTQFLSQENLYSFDLNKIQDIFT